MNTVAFAREVCNGIMAMSAVVTIVVFGEYICRFALSTRTFYKFLTFQAAFSLFVLMWGHLLRAATSWMGFFWKRMGWTAVYAGGAPDFAPGADTFWFNSGWVFVLATAIIVAGKFMVVLAFAPESLWFGEHRISWRVHLTAAFALSIFLPFFVGYVIHP